MLSRNRAPDKAPQANTDDSYPGITKQNYDVFGQRQMLEAIVHKQNGGGKLFLAYLGGENPVSPNNERNMGELPSKKSGFVSPSQCREITHWSKSGLP